MINNDFKAVYNVFTRQLAVAYGNAVSMYTFDEMEEWTKVSFNGDTKHPNYLHIQLDYDESAQLLFYPRIDGDESLHEEDGVYFNSDDMDHVPAKIALVYNEAEWETELAKISEGKMIVEISY